MDVRVRYGKRLERRLKGALKCMAEKACIDEGNTNAERLSDIICEMLELIWLCQENKKNGIDKRYETRAYISDTGISFQSETIEAAPSQPRPMPSHAILSKLADYGGYAIFKVIYIKVTFFLQMAYYNT